ncbi:MAG: hypothetical protein JXR96_06740 [Deltaproteobacteria bacterium]|nr:hypothetical protein [Deltaproteobacteria bacterium]
MHPGLMEQARLKEVIETALGAPAGTGAARARKLYSVTDLKAFSRGLAILSPLREALGDRSTAVRRFAEAMSLVTCGCHAFHRRDKSAYLQRSREQVCYCLAELLMSGDEAQQALAARIEAELLPALGGVIRAAERRR